MIEERLFIEDYILERNKNPQDQSLRYGTNPSKATLTELRIEQ